MAFDATAGPSEAVRHGGGRRTKNLQGEEKKGREGRKERKKRRKIRERGEKEKERERRATSERKMY